MDRTVLALICEAYSEDEAPDEKGKMETRLVLRFHPRMAPIKCGIFPLLKNNDQLIAKAKEIVDLLRAHMNVFYDESGAIGRRYRRQDEIGTPFGVTVDFETLGEKNAALADTVTLRERDSMKQERVKISDLADMLISRNFLRNGPRRIPRVLPRAKRGVTEGTPFGETVLALQSGR